MEPGAEMQKHDYDPEAEGLIFRFHLESVGGGFPEHWRRAEARAREALKELAKNGDYDPEAEGLIFRFYLESVGGGFPEHWRRVQEDEREALKELAKDGDPKGMFFLAIKYWEGKDGFEEDEDKAYKLSVKLHEMGELDGSALMGYFLTSYDDEEKRKAGGSLLIGAAAMGSAFGADCLGRMFLNGSHGLQRSNTFGTYWLKKSLTMKPTTVIDGENLMKIKNGAKRDLEKVAAQEEQASKATKGSKKSKK